MNQQPGSTDPHAFARSIPADARESHWQTSDGAQIRRIDWPAPGGGAPRGSLLFLPGRGDCYEKSLESLAHWHARGWAVSSTDWRGQAFSGRLGLDDSIGHIDDFAVWIADLAHFWADFRANMPPPHVVVAHSMGGHLAMRALAGRAIDPDAAVLIAPMLAMKNPPLPVWLLTAIARMACRVGDPRRAAWRAGEKPGADIDRRMALLTHDATRYADEAWWFARRPQLSMGPASWGWVAAALASSAVIEAAGALEQIKTPVMMLTTNADRLVSHRAIVRAAGRLPHGELVIFGAQARHELLRELDAVRDKALAAIDGFFDRMAPAR